MSKINAIAFDLDGTIYLGNTLIRGVPEILDYLKSIDIKVFYFTNNSGKTRKEIVGKLAGLGIKAKLEDVYCASHALMNYLYDNDLLNPFIIGTEAVIQSASEYGIIPTESEIEADCVAVCLDTAIDYKKIVIAINILKKRKKFIVCNMDRNYPVENGRIMPGCGAIASAIEYSSAKPIDFIIGKPETYMLDMLIEDKSLKKDTLMIVGDSYESDIIMANKAGIKSVLISKNNIEDKCYKKIINITKLKAIIEESL